VFCLGSQGRDSGRVSYLTIGTSWRLGDIFVLRLVCMHISTSDLLAIQMHLDQPAAAKSPTIVLCETRHTRRVRRDTSLRFVKFHNPRIVFSTLNSIFAPSSHHTRSPQDNTMGHTSPKHPAPHHTHSEQVGGAEPNAKCTKPTLNHLDHITSQVVVLQSR
jgi:hypothetical protein